MTTSPPIAGVLPVIQTPFDSEGELDFAELDVELDWVLDHGVAGLTTGMVSEVLRLTESERCGLNAAVAAKAIDRDALSIVSCGAESTKTAVAFAAHAQSVGASAVMAIGPLTQALDETAMLGYFSAIAESISIPLIVQDASGYIGRTLSIGMQVSLLDRFGDQIYFKPEAAPIGPRLSELREASDGRARAFEGSGGAALVDSFRRGIVGTMPGAEVCWAIQALWDRLSSGDWDGAYAISAPLNQLVAYESSIDTYVAIEKHLLRNQGVLRSTAQRAPLQFVLDSETADEVDRLFKLIESASRPQLLRDASVPTHP